MKFKIKYADQIVGIFSFIAIIALIVLVFAIGSGQKWFVRKTKYYTMFDSAAGLSVGMPITYKGFSLGKIKKITLEKDIDKVRVDYYILSEYQNYIKEFSLVQFAASPIGMGAKFELLPGLGNALIEDNKEIPLIDSVDGQTIIATGKNIPEAQVDSISILLSQAQTLLDNVNELLENINAGIEGDTSNYVGELLAAVDGLLVMIDDGIAGYGDNKIGELLTNVVEITANLNKILFAVGELNDIVPKILGSDMAGELNGVLNGVNKLANGVTPQINSLLKELDSTLSELQDVLSGVKANPLIKGGVRDRAKSAPSTFNTREGL